MSTKTNTLTNPKSPHPNKSSLNTNANGQQPRANVVSTRKSLMPMPVKCPKCHGTGQWVPSDLIGPMACDECQPKTPQMSDSKVEICEGFQEHIGWRNNPDKTIGVTWDGWCSYCGFRLENKSFASGVTIEGQGRRLAAVVSVKVIDGETFISNKSKIVCSKCCPIILKQSKD